MSWGGLDPSPLPPIFGRLAFPPGQWSASGRCGRSLMRSDAEASTLWSVSDEARPRTRLHCLYCGDVIGVYEPLVVQCGGDGRESSLAAEPDLWSPGRHCFHRQCYDLLTLAATE